MRMRFAALTALTVAAAPAFADTTLWGQKPFPCLPKDLVDPVPMRWMLIDGRTTEISPGVVRYTRESNDRMCAEFQPYVEFGVRGDVQTICFAGATGPEAGASFFLKNIGNAPIPLDRDHVREVHDEFLDACMMLWRESQVPYVAPVPASFPALDDYTLSHLPPPGLP